MNTMLWLRLEKYLLIMLFGLFVASLFVLGLLYYRDNAIKVPSVGGIYKEAMIGNVTGLHPLFADFNEAEQDISSLIFSGLTRYDGKQENVVGDIAEYTMSEDGKVYTFTLKPDLKWHDETPLTAEDVVFTYKEIIQNPEFPNDFLKKGLESVTIEKVDDRTVTFTLTKPYAFFPTLLTTGILPKHIWEMVPVTEMRENVLNKTPIGNGPYKMIGAIKQESRADGSSYTRIMLERFGAYRAGREYLIKNLTFDVYPTEEELRTHLSEYNGIKRINDIKERPELPNLTLHTYTLPQYVGLFFNMENPLLKDRNFRLALKLGTPKDELVAKLDQVKRIDTPFLELDTKNWTAQYDREKANGALFDAGWKVPEGQTLTASGSTVPNTTPEPPKAEEEPKQEVVAPVTVPTPKKKEYFIFAPTSKSEFKTNKNALEIKGSVPADTQEVYVNDYALKQYIAGNPAFTYRAFEEFGTLKKGDNTYTVIAVSKTGVKTTIDTLKITYDSTLTKEEELGTTPEQEANTVATPLPTVATQEETTPTPPQNTGLTPTIPVRYKNGTPAVLRLVTRSTPPQYEFMAQEIRNAWAQLGVEVQISVLSPEELQLAMDEKNYDILLFGQKLGYNLDAYPYWHSSQAGAKGANFSNYQSFRANKLLEEIRTLHSNTSEEEELTIRQKLLKELESVFADDTPAIFLYQPVYTFGLDQGINQGQISTLAFHKDRFSSLHQWYTQEKRIWTKPFSLGDFLNWLYKNIR